MRLSYFFPDDGETIADAYEDRKYVKHAKKFNDGVNMSGFAEEIVEAMWHEESFDDPRTIGVVDLITKMFAVYTVTVSLRPVLWAERDPARSMEGT